MDFSKWTTDAIDIINTKVKINQKFELKSLFEGCEWEKLSKGERINFGKYFANEVRDGKIKNVLAVERGRDNHSKYIKTALEDTKK